MINMNMNTNQVVDLLLTKNDEISSRIHSAVTEILRLGYDTDRGKQQIPDLLESIEYKLEEIERIVNR